MREPSPQHDSPKPSESEGAALAKAAGGTHADETASSSISATERAAPALYPSHAQLVSVMIATLLFLVEKVRVVIDVGLSVTTEDQTIFWYVAQDYYHGRFPEPLFYGSPYSTHLESLLAVPLMALGLKPRLAIPWVTGVLTGAPFLLLARFAWRRGHYVSSILVLCAQFLLPLEFGALATQAAQPTGAAVGGIAAAMLFSELRAPLRFASFGLFGALAVCFHPNAVYVLGPALTYALLRHSRSASFWLSFTPPLLVVATLYSLALQFYAQHPAYVLHPVWPAVFEWPAFLETVNNLDRHLGDLTPSPFRASGFLMLGMGAVAWVTLATHAWQRTTASGVLLGGLLLSFALTKVQNGGDSFTFPYSRVFYSYPHAFLWLGVLWADVAPPLPTGTAAKRAVRIAAIVLLATGLWRQINLTTEVERVLAVPQSVVPWARTDDVVSDCRALRAIAKANQVDLVLHASSRLRAYACGAEWYGKLDTLYPPYDRRTGHILQERDRVRANILIAEPPKKICRTASAHGLICTMLNAEPKAALISNPGVSALEVSKLLGIDVRRL